MTEKELMMAVLRMTLLRGWVHVNRVMRTTDLENRPKLYLAAYVTEVLVWVTSSRGNTGKSTRLREGKIDLLGGITYENILKNNPEVHPRRGLEGYRGPQSFCLRFVTVTEVFFPRTWWIP